MKLLFENWRKFVSETATLPSEHSSEDLEDSVRKAAKHSMYVKYFRPWKSKKWGGVPPTKSTWSSVLEALEIIESLPDYSMLSARDLKEKGKLGTYFPIPEDTDWDEIEDIVGDIKTKLYEDLKGMIVGRKIKIDTFEIHGSPEAKSHENEEGTIVDIPAYRGRREIEVKWDNNIPVANTIRQPHSADYTATVKFEIIDPPSMEELKKIVEQIHPAPFAYWQKKK
tara:strand:- start:399 stop:1073 length:675 start_codon:yes stop_codon:yes gene_type:complete